MPIIRFMYILFLSLVSLSCASNKYEQKRDIALSEPFAQAKAGTLFSNYDPLSIKISAPLTRLFKSKLLGPGKLKDFSVKGTLSYANIKLPIRINLKGHSTAIMCPFPKLEITIIKNYYEQTLFSEAKTVDLNTHCDEKNSNLDVAFRSSFFNHREALAYRILDILDVPTFRTRPVLVQYLNEDLLNSDYSNPYQAFFIEDMDALVKRIEAREIKGFRDINKENVIKKNPYKEDTYVFTDLSNAPRVDTEDAARIALFNEMIGNYDWFIKINPEHMRSQFDERNLWNVKIAELKNGKWVLFPYDFSLASVVTGIRNPTGYEKVFLSVNTSSQEKIKNQFLEKKQEIIKLLDSLDPMGKEYYENAIRRFFSDIK